MTNQGHGELEELEPIAEHSAQPQRQVDFQAALFQRSLAGLPAPFFNPGASKEYYRFLFAGLLIVIGCFMPFDGDWQHVGYKTVAGGCWLIIGLGIVWSMWGAINSGTMRMKWVLLAFLPFVWGLLHLIFARFPSAEQYPEQVNSWKEIFTTLADRGDTGRMSKIGNALQVVGPGKIFVCLGGLLAEVTFIGGIFSGAKRLQQQKAERIQAAAAARRK